MRRYQLQVHADPGPSSVVVGWDRGERHYACDVTYPDGSADQLSCEHLRDVIFRLQPVAVLDDALLRALLNDRARP